MVWYSSGEFDSMCIIIYGSSMCASIFRRSHLSSSILVIHSLVFLVTPSSFYLANILCSLVLEAPVFGSFPPESVIHSSLAPPYLLAFAFASSTI